MTRLTPEERAAWEAVRMDAAQRSVALDHHTGKEIEAAREVRHAVNALLAADAGAWSAADVIQQKEASEYGVCAPPSPEDYARALAEVERCSTCGGQRNENPFCSNGFHAPRDVRTDGVEREPCTACEGAGWVSGAGHHERCDGSCRNCPVQVQEQCDACAGTGRKLVTAPADAGAGEANLGKPRCAKCGGSGYYTDDAVDIEMLCSCREPQPSPEPATPTPADRDAELERRLENLFLFAFMSGQDSSGITATSAAATEEAIKWRDDVLSHVRRREEAARGEERERCAEELDAMAAAWHDKRRFALEGAAKAIRNVRLVRVPEEAEHE